MQHYEIIDNLLHYEDYNKIKNTIHGSQFPWYWIPYQVEEKEGSFRESDAPFLTHTFYEMDVVLSPHYNILTPLYNRLNINSGKLNVKANLVYKQLDSLQGNVHCDEWSQNLSHKTAVFYLGTNNGKTVLCLDSGEIEINSVDNRIVIFDASIPHYVKYQTDCVRRIVLNLNYVPLWF